MTAADAVLRRVVPSWWRGALVAAAGGAVAWFLNDTVSDVPRALAAVVIGMIIGATPWGGGLRKDFSASSKTLLRAGIVLLGFRLDIGDLADVGPKVALVVALVGGTLVGIWWLGGRFGLEERFSILIAAGYAICGASAVAATSGAIDADEDDTAYAIGLVTAAGTLAIFVMPALSELFGLSADQAGTWIGASVHDVAQVVAAASAVDEQALDNAVVVKLARVVMLAPVVALVAIRFRPEGGATETGSRPPLVPLFVVGFLAASVVTTSDVADPDLLDTLVDVGSILFTVALVGLGAGVRIGSLRERGWPPLAVALLAWIGIATAGLGVALL